MLKSKNKPGRGSTMSSVQIESIPGPMAVSIDQGGPSPFVPGPCQHQIVPESSRKPHPGQSARYISGIVMKLSPRSKGAFGGVRVKVKIKAPVPNHLDWLIAA